MGRLVPAEEDAGSEVSECELRERREREEERRVDAEELGAEGGTTSVSPHPPSWRPRMRIMGRVTFSFFLSFVLTLFLCDFFSAHNILMGQAWAEGIGKLVTCRRRADDRREPVKIYVSKSI